MSLTAVGAAMAQENEALAELATAMSRRSRLDALLVEALTAPGMALPELNRIVQFVESGDLAESQRVIDDNRGQR